MKEFPVEAIIAPCEPLHPTEDVVSLPPDLVAPGDVIYRAREDFEDVKTGDYLVCEPRHEASTGEFVIAQSGPLVYLGRWWGKHGLREVRGFDQRTLVSNPEILAVVQLIVRPS